MYFKLTQPFSMVTVSLDALMEKFTWTISQMIEVNKPIVMSENKSITFSGYHLDFKEIFEKVEKKREGSSNNCNWTRTQNHLVRKRWSNGWVFVYRLSGSGFQSSCSHLKRVHACFEQGVPWYSGNYRVWIHTETRTWHDKKIQTV